jgi:hypothetical protein
MEVWFEVPRAQLEAAMARARELASNEEKEDHDSFYLPRTERKISKRVRTITAGVPPSETIIFGKKKKIGDGVKREEEEVITSAERAVYLTEATVAGTVVGIRKECVKFTIDSFEGLEEVTVTFILKAVTYDGRTYEPWAEFECLRKRKKKAGEVKSKLTRLAILVLGPDPKPVTQSCRTRAEGGSTTGSNSQVGGNGSLTATLVTETRLELPPVSHDASQDSNDGTLDRMSRLATVLGVETTSTGPHETNGNGTLPPKSILVGNPGLKPSATGSHEANHEENGDGKPKKKHKKKNKKKKKKRKKKEK